MSYGMDVSDLKKTYAQLERDYKAFKHRSHMAALRRTYAELERHHNALKQRKTTSVPKKNIDATPMFKKITQTIRPYHSLERNGTDVHMMARQFVTTANKAHRNVQQRRKTSAAARREVDASYAALFRAFMKFEAAYAKYERRLKSNELGALAVIRRRLEQNKVNARARKVRTY